MLGQAPTPRRRHVPLAAIALLVLIVPSVGGANPTRSATSLRTHDAAIAAESRAAVLSLYSLDQQLGAANTRLARLRQQRASLRTERALLRRQLVIARTGTQLAQRRLAQRIRALYEQGDVEPLEVILGAKNLDDAMTSLDSLSRSAAQGEDVLRGLRAARRELAATARALATRESALAAETHAAEATASQLSRTRAGRTAYISSLARERRLTREQISAAVARADAAQTRTASLVRARAAVPKPVAVLEPSAAASRGTITVSATGYVLGGTTATGLPVGWGVAAVDPSVIPFGTHFTVPGYGEAVAADTGGAVVGETIDLWFPSAAQANAWGRRTVTIVLH